MCADHTPAAIKRVRRRRVTSLHDLSDRDRQIVDMFLQKLPGEEIAQRVQLRTQTVHNIISYLRECLGEHIIPRRHATPDGENRASYRTNAMYGDRAGHVRCLGGCGETFYSPDRCRIRICANCKRKNLEKTGGIAEHRIFPS